MKRHQLLVGTFLIVIAMQGWMSAQPIAPSTQPALNYYSGPQQLGQYSLENAVIRVKFMSAPSVPDATEKISGLIDGLCWSSTYTFSLGLNRIATSGSNLLTDQLVVFVDNPTASVKGQEIAQEAFRRLKTLVTSDPPMSAQQLNQRLAELENGLASVLQKEGVISQLAKAQPDAPARVSEKLRHLRESEQDLQMKLSAREARRVALEKGLAELKDQVQSQRKDDPKLAFFRADVDAKQRIYDLKVQQMNNGFAQVTETVEAEAALRQAKLALTVAEADAAKGGRGELMDKLANELTMVSIDTTDLQIQLKQIHDIMAKYDVATLNAANLNALLQGDDNLGGEKLPPLYYELQKQANDLRREELVLIVDDVSFVTETQQQP